MRLDRLLANSGYGSRTAVKDIIRKGKVTVAGLVVTDGGYQVEDFLQNTITIEDSSAKVRKYLHFLLNKPSGVITALEDSRHRTIAEFIPSTLATVGLFPVGRLDIDTTGLLLLTNDGTLCHRLASPKWHVDKTYYFEISGKYLDDIDTQKLQQGLILTDGLVCKPAILEIQTPYSGMITIQEGKYHQVKRMMKALGGTITVLERRVMGPVVLDTSLAPGELRELSQDEITMLYEAVGMVIE